MSELFDRYPNRVTVQPFSHAKAFGFVIPWILNGTGFGEVTVSFHRDDHTWYVDDEHTSEADLLRIFALLAAACDTYTVPEAPTP